LHAFGDPAFEFPEGIAADGELDEMKWHVGQVSAQRRLLKASVI
jgi:hypothetical protein